MALGQTDFSSGKMYKNILGMAIPGTIAQVINLLYNIVDRMFIGRLGDVGDLALTGVGLCFPLLMLSNAFINLYGMTGGAPLFSIERGRENEGEAKRIMGTSFLMLVLTGILLTVVGLVFFKPIITFFGASSDTFVFAKDYGTVYLLGCPFALVAFGMNPFINAQGFGWISMFSVSIGAACNILLDPIFIFVFNMGIRGAAIATVLSQIVSAVFVVVFLTSGHRELRLTKEMMKLQWSRIKRIISLGFSGFVMGCTSSLVQIVCNRTASLYGGDLYVGVITVLNSVREIFMVPLNGLTNGAIPIIGYNYGKKEFARIKEGVRFILFVGIGFALVTWIFVQLFAPWFIRIFNDSPDMVRAGTESLRIFFFGFFMMAFQLTGQATFVSLGKSKHATFFSLLRKVIIVVPLTLFLPTVVTPAINGVFWAEPVSNVLGGLLCYTTMYFTLKKEASLVKEEIAKYENV